MMNSNTTRHRPLLEEIARRAMIDRGLVPDFSPQANAELDAIHESGMPAGGPARDLRNLCWCSIDNDSSRDLDQLTVAGELEHGDVKVLVAIADVDALVKKGSAIDDHARHNTASVYTPARIFPMLPEKLSTGLTSLNLDSDRSAMVIEMVFTAGGSLAASNVYPAAVRNRAKLAYNSIAGWLDSTGPRPDGIANVNGLEENILLQDRIAQALKTLRHVHGALDFETIEASPVFDGDSLKGLEAERGNRAKSIIEDFMIAANGVTARFLESRQMPCIRRVVRTPKRWDRIIELASQHDFTLPGGPDPKALSQFLAQAKSADPLRFPDLSLSVIKLLGPGEYVVERPGGIPVGHFGLAVKDYAHATAPNRRYPDLITQRLLKTALNAERSSPYPMEELEALAKHCTEMEDAVKKVERQVVKSAAAMLLESSIGRRFDALVTGASGKGTWVRITNPPVEGRLVRGFEGLDVGHRLRVKLLSTNVERGFIDFESD
jgi:VacB/RNase II family 3'-5' exoribonuclease